MLMVTLNLKQQNQFEIESTAFMRSTADVDMITPSLQNFPRGQIPSRLVTVKCIYHQAFGKDGETGKEMNKRICGKLPVIPPRGAYLNIRPIILYLDAPHFQYFDPNAHSYLRALRCLETYIQMNGPFDRVLGFSQGAGLALTYLIRHKHLYPDVPLPFKLAVLFSRVGVYDLGQWIRNGTSVPLTSMPRNLNKIDLSVAMVWGENDWDAAKFEATTTTALDLKEAS
ncbi:uncharacterized protein CC84DRAFT_1178478 [Paraphaeosphaeria sporulosa]|uniref:Serine hydrolase domain-containing protein n=1 Tax=Paraphaeosphaeria sporulosa TaxID=1460663 RepID=A0A177C713_9PLEO|nr:uncharacterized protein CC84DRAFT_1178478 [Paraphaeosphaeria sporulosa]OAG02911.1 hypothetical protein CC84DRAFT_1178478 [Paraphaeosphaeria sporulosa]